ncbi:Uma2 family endonuclease [Paenibacillus sp. J5C_2022]|uniref:Uma2 family endonuclease n=1 Tax=Paenibacillus sp. J5C2022 TaxID=2977129 RepID=UPI0021D39EEF|nr:Uma2 family endonuclease [Paenibacillus sp. J5C2022]MCU6710240.1 Uma2 family endonuclease [Paenibacillus sp. J5C2022]
MNRNKNDKDANLSKKKDKIREQPVTYEMYAELPDDGQRYEIFDGVLELMSPGPSPRHQDVSRELEFILMQSCRADYLIYHAPIDVILSDSNVVQPDVLLIHRSRLHIVTRRGIEGAPDLVVEIVSPGSRSRDRITKLGLYARHGIPEYWVIDSDSLTLEQYKLIDGGQYELINLFEGDDRVYSDKLPYVSFSVSEIFREVRA